MVLEEITSRIPDFGLNAGTIFGALVWLIFIFIFGIAAALMTWMVMRNKKFNIRIILYQKISGRFEPIVGRNGFSAKAMLQRIGEAGDNVLYVAKYKKFLPTPSIQSGRNIYYFFIREDGEWINFGLEDLDNKSREIGAYFLDKEMRYQRAALQKNLRERHQKLTFMEKYGGMIVWITLILVIIVGFTLWMDKLIEITGAVDAMTKTASTETKEILNAVEGLVVKLNNVCGGSGITSV